MQFAFTDHGYIILFLQILVHIKHNLIYTDYLTLYINSRHITLQNIPVCIL